MGDLLEHQPSVRELPVVGRAGVRQQLGAFLSWCLGAVVARRIVLVGSGQHRECGQIGRPGWRPGGPHDAAEDLSLDLEGVAVADRGGGHQLGHSRIGVGQHRGRHVRAGIVVACAGDLGGGAVQEALQVASALAVEHADDEANGRVETSGQQRCRHVDLVVGVGQRECRGPLHARGPQDLFVGVCRHEKLDGRVRVAVQRCDLGAAPVAS